jgi:MoxR-like ATPase
VEDVQAVAYPILRHRLIPNFSAQSEGLTSDKIIAKLLETIPADERLYDGNAKHAKPAVS